MKTHPHHARYPFPAVNVGGVPFQIASLSDACRWVVEEAAVGGLGVNIRLANAYNIALASRDESYFSLLADEGVNFPDGTPVVWFMKLREARTEPRRVRGPSLFREALKLSEGSNTRHFFLGGSPETLAKLEAKARENYPGIVVAGSYSPPFSPVDDSYIHHCVEAIRASGANLVWVGLGTPKQDLVGTELSRHLNIATVNVGAAFDFFAGTVDEPPVWVQSSGFEWLFRLASEPKRLWRRYLIGNLQFLWAAFCGLVVRKSTP